MTTNRLHVPVDHGGVRRMNNVPVDAVLMPQRHDGRVYGGGFHELDPKELGSVPAPEIPGMLPRNARPDCTVQGDLFETRSCS